MSKPGKSASDDVDDMSALEKWLKSERLGDLDHSQASGEDSTFRRHMCTIANIVKVLKIENRRLRDMEVIATHELDFDHEVEDMSAMRWIRPQIDTGRVSEFGRPKVVEFNVGGKVFVVSSETLAQVSAKSKTLSIFYPFPAHYPVL